MRLPPNLRSLSICTITLIIACAVGLPLGARAASQQLIGSAAKIDFGTLTIGQTQTEMVVLTNTGTTGVSISAISASQAAYQVSGIKLPFALAAGQSTTFNVTFTPSETGWIYGTLVVSSTASNANLDFQLAGGGGELKRLQAAPATVSFGNVAVGKSLTIPVVVTNMRPTSMTVKGFLYYGSGFTASGPALPLTLNGGQSTTIDLTFTPTSAGIHGASVLVRATQPLNIPVTGTGTTGTTTTNGPLVISPSALSFGSVQVGTSSSQKSSMSVSSGSVTVTSAASSNGQFAIAGVSFPVTVTAGQNVPYQVTYTPTTSGNASTALSFVTSGSSTAASASGTGVMPSVTLSWSPSTSQVAGYNVYRGTAVGSYSKLNNSLDSTTTFTDNTVAPGATYYYAATSVSSSGQESGLSAPIQVSIP